MKAIMVMFDSLNRHYLPPYGCDWVHAPNFRRLAEKSVVFDNCWVGSMPCMPARRDMQTGRYNFLHRSWGPMEPFDDSAPELLKNSGVYTHLVTDHQHYWEDGGCTYHSRYNSYEFIRGQEGDPWKGEVRDPAVPDFIGGHSGLSRLVRQDWVNRGYIQSEDSFPQARTFRSGIDFIEKNHKQDRWFLQIETFDPHEPFFAPQKYRDLYPHDYDGPHFDWPPYNRVQERPEQVEHCRLEYAALVSMCDAYLGRILDKMDELGLWEDTLLIVNTDHGFLLGEHGWWAKCVQPFYNEIARTPLIIWDPRTRKAGERRSSLVQLIDMAPTLLDFFGADIPQDMQGKPLSATVERDEPVREALLFGIHGGHVNCTDGRYVYMRAPARPDSKPLYNYTLMPTHMRSFFSLNELGTAQLAEPFSFTKGLRTMQLDATAKETLVEYRTELFDLERDPGQTKPIHDAEAEGHMIRQLIRLMQEADAPAEQYERLGLAMEPA